MRTKYGIPIQERLDAYTDKSGDCWLWTGTRHHTGYGKLKVKRDNVSVHRLSYELNVGKIPPGMFVCHHCDTPLCIRPDHLFVGTSAENTADMVGKGRGNRGERNGHARLTAADVEKIRFDYAAGGVSQAAIAARYDMSRAHIGFIVSGVRWSHLTHQEAPVGNDSAPATGTEGR